VTYKDSCESGVAVSKRQHTLPTHSSKILFKIILLTTPVSPSGYLYSSFTIKNFFNFNVSETFLTFLQRKCWHLFRLNWTRTCKHLVHTAKTGAAIASSINSPIHYMHFSKHFRLEFRLRDCFVQ